MEISDNLKKYLDYESYFATMGTLKAKNPASDVAMETSPKSVIEELRMTDISRLVKYCAIGTDKAISSKNIPQISQLEPGTMGMVNMLMEHGDYGMSYVDIGKAFLGEGRSDAAYIKFGENHAKLAKELDLVYTVKIGQLYVYVSDLGKELLSYSQEEQEAIIARLMLSIPVVRYIIKIASEENVNVVDLMAKFVSYATAERRMYSVKKVLAYVKTVTKDESLFWNNIEYVVSK